MDHDEELFERVTRALHLLANGVPLRRAAEESGTTLRSVVRVCEEQGIPLRKEGRKYVLDTELEEPAPASENGAPGVLVALAVIAWVVAALRRRRREGPGRGGAL